MNRPEPPDNEQSVRRIAVILGSSGGGSDLLNILQPLLAHDQDIEMQGVFIEEAEVQNAAELPFVQELCRVTFNVREFSSRQFEKSLELRMRTARKALDVLAQHTGVRHSFRSVRGPRLNLLHETALRSDITVFEPRCLVGSQLPRRKPLRHLVAVINDPESATEVLRTASALAGSQAQSFSVVLFSDLLDQFPKIEQQLSALPHGQSIQVVSGSDLASLTAAARSLGASLLVMPAGAGEVTKSLLRHLSDNLHCPVCLVRRWTVNDGQLEC